MNINFDLLNKYKCKLAIELQNQKKDVWKYETQEKIVNSIFAGNDSSCEERFYILDRFYSTRIFQHKNIDIIERIIQGLNGIQKEEFKNLNSNIIQTIANLHRGNNPNARGLLSFATKYAFHSAKGLGVEDKDNKYVILDSKVLETLEKIGYTNPQTELCNFANYEKYCNLIGEIQTEMKLSTKRECELLLWKISKYNIVI